MAFAHHHLSCIA